MQKKAKSKMLSRILCMMLIVAMAWCTVGCNKKEQEKPQDVNVTAPAEHEQTDEKDADAGQQDESNDAVTVLGEGKVAFDFSVMDKEGNETKYEIHTDKTTVGDALLELGLIEGDAGDYGLYVKKVNGITADYDVDKTYWAFYVNGEYAMSGVDATQVTGGDTYMFKVEK